MEVGDQGAGVVGGKPGAVLERERPDQVAQPDQPVAEMNALGRKPSAVEADRLTRLLAVQRDEFQTYPESAKALLGGDGDARSIREAEEAAAGRHAARSRASRAEAVHG